MYKLLRLYKKNQHVETQEKFDYLILVGALGESIPFLTVRLDACNLGPGDPSNSREDFKKVCNNMMDHDGHEIFLVC